MEILIRTTKYSWLNKLSKQERIDIVNFYLQGFPVFRISKAFCVAPSTIEHHLMKAQVLVAGRKPFAKGKVVRNNIEAFRGLTIPAQKHLVTKIDNDKIYYDEYGYAYKQSNKSYRDYLKEERTRKHIPRSNEFVVNHGAGEGWNNFKCMIHVDLVQDVEEDVCRGVVNDARDLYLI